MVFYLTLIRVVLFGVVWIVPLPLRIHRVAYTALGFLGLFASLDSLAIAYVIMIPGGQLNAMYRQMPKSKNVPQVVQYLTPGISVMVRTFMQRPLNRLLNRLFVFRG